MRKLIAVAVAIAAVVCVPVALAASSPTVLAAAATGIGEGGATLHGSVNPNGLATTYQFHYGPTSALGSVSPATAVSAGAGDKAVAESTKLTGLSPDTTYYYQLVASSSAGSSATPTESFQTTGNPAPQSTTDAATGVGRNLATLVGTIAPNNQATTYYFQYGLTSSYGFQTAAEVLTAGTAPETVTAVLPGLAPGTVFHYRLVASHGATATTMGDDMTFETLPWPRRNSGVSLAVSPSTVKGSSARVTARGTLKLAAATSASVGCNGVVTVRYYSGRRTLHSVRALVSPRCSFSASTVVRDLRADRAGIRVEASFAGNTYQAPARRTVAVKVH